MTTAISIDDLSKQYRLGQVGTGTISHDLNRWWAKLRGKEDPYSTVGQTNKRDQAADGEYVWALKDINLTIEKGEVVGIIGANGAGKSTLLKLISRITAPTTGTIKARGRIACLLEVGTGMHPELTARENIYMNGAILGMRRHEITRKLDDIIDFAGCRMFIDTPVKRFSSGMRVRLGFAVAAFLEPEILIVDEVLAVGDADFQQKAIGKMKEVSRSEGRTILFVSHNLGSVKTLCQRGIVLAEGGVAADEPVEDAVAKYVRHTQPSATTGQNLLDRTDRSGDGQVKIAEFWIENQHGERDTAIPVGSDAILAVRLVVNSDSVSNVDVGFSIHDPQDLSPLTILYSGRQNQFFSGDTEFNVRCRLADLPFPPGKYPVGARVVVGHSESDWIKSPIGELTSASGDFFGFGRPINSGTGKVLLKSTWSEEKQIC
ncbi:MAG: ABC transporter ATP-binding protein [Planctomycetaceae bacterium]|nr:ABC transporter ATP-binding protein [Planctomycetaceae bacterium]